MSQVLNELSSNFKFAKSIFKFRSIARKKKKDKKYTIYCIKTNSINTIYGVLAAYFGL